jgi:hypothetical protein
LSFPFPAFAISLPSSHQINLDGRIIKRMLVLKATAEQRDTFYLTMLGDSSKITGSASLTDLGNGHMHPYVERFLINFLLWLDSNPQKHPEKKRSKKRSRRRHSARPTVWSIGKDVVLHPLLIKEAREASSRGKVVRKSGWKLRNQHIVRGHFKEQPCGPKGQNRKTIWIEPYWRGPEGAEAWSHIYK